MPPTTKQLVPGKGIYLLALVVVVQSIYPITGDGSLAGLLIYQLLYASLIVVGILIARETRAHLIILTALAILWLLSGSLYAFNQEATWALMLGYGAIWPFQAMLIQVLLRFIFGAERVTGDVLYAASAVYLLLGALFVPVYGLIETLLPGSFVDGALPAGALFPWQHFVYYSYATLTTVGYGDVLPVSLWARSAASLEAIIGVLYLTIIMARLVGLYAQERQAEAGG